jgi:2-polyprenyl-6-methoxyphenol hydroxylase-like FAD-dependent oxidoreductase
MDRPHIIVIGAGVGGLCLAQGLSLSGVSVNVYERDASPTTSMSGYRLSISPTGSRALKSCLPGAVFDRLTLATGEPSRAVTFLDHRLNRLLAIDLPAHDRRSLDSERPIGRAVLRRVLLDGLDGVVRFNKTFVAYRHEPDGRITALFSDGEIATGDLIVGADGANSKVRAQLLPGAARVETGIVAIGGKLTLTESAERFIPDAAMRGPTPILGPRGSFLFLSPVAYRDLGETFDPDASRSAGDRENYLLWGFSARRERFGAGEPYAKAAADDLKSLVERMLVDWHPVLRQVVRESDPATVSWFSVKTSTPVKPWPTANVTLLGDALHNMPPYRGIGANAALWDAALLRESIIGSGASAPLTERLAEYERRMIEHGFHAVETSLAAMRQFHAEGAFERFTTRAFFRAADRLPILRPMLMGER